MSMFGLIYTGIVLFCKGIVGVGNSINDSKSRSDAANKGNLCYYDHKGGYRLVSDNQYVYRATLNNGERVLKNNSGQIVHNFDHDRRMNALERYNNEIREKNEQIVALGTFEDLFPELVRTGIYFFLPDKTIVYKYLPNGKKFFRKKGFFQGKHDLFIDFDSGLYTVLNQKVDKQNQDWVDKKNAIMNEIGTYKITLDQIDCFFGV